MKKSLILWLLVIFAVAPARFARAQSGAAAGAAAQASEEFTGEPFGHVGAKGRQYRAHG